MRNHTIRKKSFCNHSVIFNSGSHYCSQKGKFTQCLMLLLKCTYSFSISYIQTIFNLLYHKINSLGATWIEGGIFNDYSVVFGDLINHDNNYIQQKQKKKKSSENDYYQIA